MVILHAGKKNLEFIDKNFAVNLKSELDQYRAKLRKITTDHEDKNQSNQNEENGKFLLHFFFDFMSFYDYFSISNLYSQTPILTVRM